MNADDLAIQLWDELRKHPLDARQFMRGLLEQMSTAELTDLVAANVEDEVQKWLAGSATEGL